MRLVLIGLLVLLLCGCQSELDGWAIREAQTVCEDRGGVETLHVFGRPVVECGNGMLVGVERAD